MRIPAAILALTAVFGLSCTKTPPTNERGEVEPTVANTSVPKSQPDTTPTAPRQAKPAVAPEAKPAVSTDVKRLQVFILAGQSNMEGHGKVDMGKAPSGKGEVKGGTGSIKWYAKQHPDRLGPGGDTPIVDAAGEMLTRDDVWIYTTTSGKPKGLLTTGFGKGIWFGPEFGFGHVVGNALDDPVLIIKTAWGGMPLGVEFRPPSAAMPAYKHDPEKVGQKYREMIQFVRKSLEDCKTDFPELADCEVRIAGFGWHQGWNDGCSKDMADEYEQNMAALIKDVRREFGAPDMPFVIATTGQNGEKTRGNMLTVCEAQKAMADPVKHPEFAGTVAVVDTIPFKRDNEEAVSGFGYHWNHSGVSHWLVGESMGKAMLGLLTK